MEPNRGPDGRPGAEPHAIVTHLLNALPAGSYLLLSHPTAEIHRAAVVEYTRLWNQEWCRVCYGGLIPARSAPRSRWMPSCGAA